MISLHEEKRDNSSLQRHLQGTFSPSQGALAKLFDPLVARIAPAYQAAVGKELKRYGLRYEDLYDAEGDLDVGEALRRLEPAEVEARLQRLKRAFDISMKHTELPKELQAAQTPYNFYLSVSQFVLYG